MRSPLPSPQPPVPEEILGATREALEAIGNNAHVARLLRVSPGLVSQWKLGRRPVASRHILKLERASGISRHRLCPGVFGELQAHSAQQATCVQDLRHAITLIQSGQARVHEAAVGYADAVTEEPDPDANRVVAVETA